MSIFLVNNKELLQRNMQRIIESVDVGEKVMSNNPLKENIFTFWGIEMTNSVSGERS